MLQSFKIGSAAVSALTAVVLAAPTSAAELGATDETIKLAINEWTGQHISTHIAGEVLRSMGYDVEYVTAGNYPQHTALADGDLHATLEVWTNNVGDIYPKMKEAGKIVDIGPLGLTTREDGCTPSTWKRSARDCRIGRHWLIARSNSLQRRPSRKAASLPTPPTGAHVQPISSKAWP